MKALEMTGPRKSHVIEVPDLEPSAGQVLVKVKYTGVCMSEWHPWADGRPGQRMGHEPFGTVAALGEGVTGFKVGDRVTGLCSSPSYSEYCLFQQENLVHVPDSLSDEDAVGEPLSCLVSVASKLRIEKAGDPAAVVGTGYMGLGTLTLLKLQGAGKVIAVDPRPAARENALRFGATEAYAPEDVPKDYIVTEWDSTMMTRGIAVVSEFSGTEDGLRLAGDMTAVHGTLGVGGWHQGGMRTVDFRLWGWKGIVVNNTHERRVAFQVECCKNALDMLSGGIWNFKGVSNHIYGLDAFDRANEDLVTKPGNLIKALVRCSDW
jgi:threonine dehydrogenase-like Zn-dependent dehydrogenase